MQYEGDLKRDTALLSNAKIDLQRYQKLWKEDSISQQTLATQQALVKQYEGNVETDMGLIQSTKLNLIYCNISSPIDGRIGLRLVDAGNFMQASAATTITVITSHDPMTVIFPVAEDYLPQIAPQTYADKPLEAKAYDISYKNNAPVRLSDVAEVIDGAENDFQAAWVNKEPAIILNIKRQPGANVIEVATRS